MNLVLVNSLGQKVRNYNWDSPAITMIQRLDTGRVEATNNTKELTKQGVKFEVLAQSTLPQLKKGPCSLGQYGELRLETKKPEVVSPSVYGAEENKSFFDSTLQRSAIVHILIIAFFFAFTWTHNTYFKEEKKTVEVKPREIKTFVVKKKKAPTVAAANKVAQKKVKRKKIAPRKKVVRKKRKNVAAMGALGALGNLKKNRKGGSGLNLKSIHSFSGSGSNKGKRAKSLRAATLNGRGLLARSAGKSKKVRGAFGYGTKGRAGGKSGYGKVTIAGKGGSYYHPLQELGIVASGLEKSQIAAVINRNIGQVIYCYEKGLQKQPKLKGRVAVKFIIGPTGKVKTARVASSSLRHQRVEGCITGKLKAWNFPKPRGRVNVNVTYPFILKRIGQG